MLLSYLMLKYLPKRLYMNKKSIANEATVAIVIFRPQENRAFLNTRITRKYNME